MGYMLPLIFINVSRDPVVSICATRITSMMSTKFYQARRSIHEEKKAGTLINACGTNAAKTAILLDNGVVVSSPMSVSVLMNSIEKANEKMVRGNRQPKVYDVDVTDDEIDEAEDIQDNNQKNDLIIETLEDDDDDDDDY